jgi:hypothetical protein
MSKGTFTGTAASAEALAADTNRGPYTIIMTDASAALFFGFGEDAEADKGVTLARIGDTLYVEGYLADLQLNVIGNGGIAIYQTGQVQYTPGPTPAA